MKNLIIICFAASAITLAAAPGDLLADEFPVPFRGELVDGDLQPISGVFPMTFKLYEAQDSAEPVWAEMQWVSVVEGEYRIDLGDTAAVPETLHGQTLIIGDELGTLGEITRHNVTIAPAPEDGGPAPLPDLVFAHIAEHAQTTRYADEAGDCETLGGMTADDLNRYEEVLGEINELRAEIETRGAPQIGSRTVVLDRVGGTGGERYSAECPPGHVVTGIQGGSGALIDSIELICSPLE